MTKKQDKSFTGEVKSQYYFTWRIPNFSKDFELFESETFCIYPLCNSSWKVLLYFRDKTDTMQIGMRRIDENSHSVAINSEFFLRNTNGTLFVKRNLSKIFSGGQESLYCDKDLKKSTSLKGVNNDTGFQFRLCVDDVLVIEGYISIVPCCSEHNVSRKQSSDQLVSALESSLAQNIFTDVLIDVGGNVVAAHKFILAARSPVFKRMLETKMKEKIDNRIEITDVDRSVFDTFLKFLYTGCLKECEFAMLTELYILADKYDVKCLFESCSSAIALDISDTTVCDILGLAEFHNDKQLKEKSFQFLCDNFKLVEPTEEWDRFVKENTLLAAKIVCKVASNISANSEM